MPQVIVPRGPAPPQARARFAPIPAPGRLVPGAAEYGAFAAIEAARARTPFALRPAALIARANPAPGVRVGRGQVLFMPPPEVPPAVSSVNGEADTPSTESSDQFEFTQDNQADTSQTQTTAVPGPRARAVFDIAKWGRTATVPWALTTVSVLALAAPNAWRTFLNIRNDVSSAGYLYIAFDHPASVGIAAFSLAPGGNALFDAFVPNGDLYLASSATALAVVTFANMPF